MDIKEFKKFVDEVLLTKGMKKRRSNYYFDNEEIISVLGLQKTSYTNGYYLNFGYVIKDLNTKEHPNYTDGNIRLRFEFKINRKLTDLIDIYNVEKELLIEQFHKNINNYILPIKKISDLQKLIKKEPELLSQATLETKKFLNMN
ncbi:hypothetical protein CN514_14150 [Bacillus sp. AFS001701]|uniref:DUF4304 domain-containing protein n=1 Tax=Bacillus sp. AFS001701 TaxID=2033480 RepID=UPI000BF56942|nr:DUF4304 domain-containing protein [Bacillus sp. AFS001701]PET60663.1 hypothetical protein CN514_14150 [Bacillus sp. AFS001701]